MAKGRIDSIIAFEDIQREKASLLKILDEIETKIGGMAKVKIDIQGAGNFKQLSSAQAEYNAYIKDTDRLKKQLLDTEKKLHESESTYTKLIASGRAELQKKNAELKASAQYEAANTGSIEKARAAIKQLTQERNQLNLYTEEGRAKQAKLNAEIDKYNNFIKNSVSLLEQQKINVGNYAGSLAKPFESLQRTLDKLRSTDLKSMGGPNGSVPRDSSREAASRQLADDLDKIFVKASREGATATQQVKQLEAAFQKLSLAADPADKEMQAFLTEFKKEVGQAKDAVQDLKDEIKLNASDTKGIDNVVGSLNALAGVAQGAAGAYALLGANEEDAAKITSKLIAVQGIANSIREAGRALTEKGTIANRAYVFMQGLVATATDATAAATVRLGAVMKLTGVVAITAGLAALVYWLSTAGDKEKDLTDRQQALNDAMEATKETVAGAVKTVFELRNNIQLAKEGFVSKELVVKQYNETIGKTTGEVKTLDEAEKALAKNAEAYIQYTLLKAEATYALGEAAKEAVNAQVLAADKEQKLADIRKQSFGAFSLLDKKSAEDLVTKSTNKALDDATNRGVTLFKLFESLNKQAGELAKKFKFNGSDLVPKDKAEKTTTPQSIKDNTAEDLLKSQYEINKLKIEQDAEANRRIFEDEKKSYEERISALREFQAQQIALVELEKQFSIAQENIRLTQVIEGLEKQKKVKGAKVKEINEQEEREVEASDKRLELIEAKSIDALIKLGYSYVEALKKIAAANKSLREKELKEAEDFQKSLENIADTFASKGYINNELSRIESERKANEKIKDLRKQLYQELQTTLFSFLTASVDREAAALDAKKAKLDADTERRINQINLLGLSEVDRTREVAKVQKEAAFQNEQIEKRKRQLANERARYEKAANIASIITGTAQAVVAALGSKPYTPANIAMAFAVGAIGAFQLVRAIAAPLPQYRHGTPSAKKGTALVSEEGPELMKRNGQLFLTPSQPSLIELMGGEEITPAHLTKDIMRSISFSQQATKGGLIMLKPNGMTEDQANKLLSKVDNLAEITSKSRILIHNEHGIESSPYYLNNIKG